MRGFLAGYPMVDFKATVFDGSFHAVDSNELSFKMAGSLAFKDAMTRARPTILEPVMKVEVYAPSDFAGDLMGDLNGRRGRICRHGHARRDDPSSGRRCRWRRCSPTSSTSRRPPAGAVVPDGVLALRRGAAAAQAKIIATAKAARAGHAELEERARSRGPALVAAGLQPRRLFRRRAYVA